MDAPPKSLTSAEPEPFDSAAPCRPPLIQDFELLRRIGSGSYGDVWLARNVLGQCRAVKIIYRSRFVDPRPFEREFEGIQRFEPISRSHSSQLHILHVGKNDAAGCFYYVMELADAADIAGEKVEKWESEKDTMANSRTPTIDPQTYSPKTLRSLLSPAHFPTCSPASASACSPARPHRLPISDCVQIGLSLATALAHLHEQGLVHRDIKPSNILFVNGVAKLGDIGLVTEAGDTQSIVGTEGYLPPEGPGTPQADLFSLGKVLYEMSTGLDRRQLPQLPADLRTWPDAPQVFEFNEIVLRACAKDPAQRYQTAEQLRADLVLLHEGKSVRRVRGTQRLWAQVKKVALGLVLLVVVAGVGRLTRQTQRNEASAEGPPSTNEMANALCEKALMHLRFDNFVGLGEVYTNLHRAIELDPHFARPYVGLFELRTLHAPRPGLQFRTNETLRSIAQRLTELGSNLAATYCAQSCLSFWDLDFLKAKALAQKAVELGPDYEFGRMCYGFMLINWGLPDEGRREIDAARHLQPSKAMTYRCYGHIYYIKRDFTNACAMYRQTIAWEPHHVVAYRYLARACQALGHYSNSLPYLEKASALTGTDPLTAKRDAELLRSGLERGGVRGYWEEEWRQTAAYPDSDFYWKATVRCRLEDIDGALRWLNRSWETRERNGVFPPIICLLSDEVWDPLHSDPRFKELLDKIGFTKVNPKLKE